MRVKTENDINTAEQVSFLKNILITNLYNFLLEIDRIPEHLNLKIMGNLTWWMVKDKIQNKNNCFYEN